MAWTVGYAFLRHIVMSPHILHQSLSGDKSYTNSLHFYPNVPPTHKMKEEVSGQSNSKNIKPGLQFKVANLHFPDPLTKITAETVHIVFELNRIYSL